VFFKNISLNKIYSNLVEVFKRFPLSVVSAMIVMIFLAPKLHLGAYMAR